MTMEKIINLKTSNLTGFYKKMFFYKLLSLFKIKLKLTFDRKEKLKKYTEEQQTIINCINILNSNTRQEKYNLIYDYSCDYLDGEFINKNLCGFKNNMCACNRSKPEILQLSSCCESGKIRTICEHFDKNKKTCKIKSIGCKLFTCPYLHRKGIKYPIKKIPYLKYFLSTRQKLIVKSSTFQDKDVIVNKLLKFYKMP